MKIDENRRQVYVTTYGNDAVAIIDTNTDQYLDSKTFGPGIWGMAVNPNLNYVYIGLRDANRVKTLYDPAAHEISPCGGTGARRTAWSSTPTTTGCTSPARRTAT